MTFLGYKSKIKSSTRKKQSQESKDSSGVLWKYHNITLRLYLEIAETKNYLALIVSGESTAEICAKAWAEIISKHNRVNKNSSFDNFVRENEVYNRIFSEYLTITSYLLSLLFIVDDAQIAYLKSKGIKIITDGTPDQTKSVAYVKSIEAGLQKRKNWTNRMTIKEKEMFKMTGSDKPEVKQKEMPTYEDAIASVNISLGFAVGDNITLAQYNAYQKRIQERNAAQLKNAPNGR